MLSSFLKDVSDPHAGIISPQRVSERLHISTAKLAQIVGVHRNTLAKNPASPVVQEELGEIARIISRAAQLVGEERAVIWFKNQPLAGFDGQTASELVAEGHGEAVLTHLEMLADGAYA